MLTCYDNVTSTKANFY